MTLSQIKKFQDSNTIILIQHLNLKPVYARNESSNANEYTKPISEYRSGNVVINNHGFDWSSNGTKWKYTTTDTAPNGLTDNTDYYIRFVNEDLISSHTS